MKILLISEFFPTGDKIDIHGGVEMRSFQLAKFLAQKHTVTVITSFIKGSVRAQQLNQMRIYRVGQLREYTNFGQIIHRFMFILATICRSLSIDFDLVEGAGGVSWLPAWLLGVVKNKPKIAVVADTVEAYIVSAPLGLMRLFKVGEKFLLQRNWSKIICISQTIRDKLIKIHLNPKKIAVIYCGADIKEIANIKTKKATRLTICCVSRLVAYKRIINLIQALKLLNRQYPQMHLSIIGSGPTFPNLLKLTRELHLERKITFYQQVISHQQVISFIKQSHIFCLPSVVEGFGIATIEALACGIPAVLADIKVNREITKGKGVLFFQPQNSADLANKIK